MGLTDVRLRIENLRDSKKAYEGKFLVDSGASFTVVNKDILRKLGIKPEREEEFDLADGKTIKREVGSAMYEFEGIKGATPILFGEPGDANLLGAFTLEALGLSLDPLKRRVYKATLRL